MTEQTQSCSTTWMAIFAGISEMVASADLDDSLTGPTLEQLLPDPAQREVLRRTFSALGVEL